MTRPGNPMLDVEDAIGELEDLSLLERIQSDVTLLNVPQSAYRYVREFELQDSVYRPRIAADASYLRMVGVLINLKAHRVFSSQPFGVMPGDAGPKQTSVDHIIQHLAEVYTDGWLDAYEYYEAIGNL